MKKNGFTLMELLLVVAILAIVAAVAAPTFSKGAADAMMEARKSNFYSAYQNAVSGANMMIAIQTAQGKSIAGKNTKDTRTGYLEDRDIDGLKIDELRNGVYGKGLMYYSPIASRIFTDINGKTFAWTAILSENGSTLANSISFVLLRAENNKISDSKDMKYGVRISSYSNPTQELAKIWNNGDVDKYYIDNRGKK